MSHLPFCTIGIRPIFSLSEADLKKSLLSPALYEASVRPRINASHAVHVQLDIQVIYILGLVCSVNHQSYYSNGKGWGITAPTFNLLPTLVLRPILHNDRILSYKGIKFTMKCFMYLWITQSQMADRL